MSRRAETSTIVEALRILSRDIQSDDGVATMALLEAAERMQELENECIMFRAEMERRNTLGKN